MSFAEFAHVAATAPITFNDVLPARLRKRFVVTSLTSGSYWLMWTLRAALPRAQSDRPEPSKSPAASSDEDPDHGPPAERDSAPSRRAESGD